MYEEVRQWAVNRGAVKQAFKGVVTLVPSVMDDYVAGETRTEALDYVSHDLNENGITGLVDLLGEHHIEKEDVDTAYDEYTALLEGIDTKGIDAELSIKLTQLGLDIDEALCKEYVEDLAAQSTDHDRRLWIDMEDTAYTDTTIGMYQELLDEDYNVGLCIQAYLKRSKDDIQHMPEDAAIRLVKGAYDKDREFETWEDVDGNYENLLDQLFASDKYVAVATHDDELIDHAKERIAMDWKAPDDFEFQFLQGVRADQAQKLAENHDVAVYVPFGEDAFDYFWRRVQEHPKYLEDVMRDEARTVIQSLRERVDRREIG